MKVSIIIPTYNVEPYILECLRSVAGQTYKEEMECIIVDDCGNDNSIPLSEKFITEYEGSISFKIVHREKNGGLSAARNSGLDVATGDYVYFLDSDDYIEPFTIEKLVKTALQYPNAEVIQAGIVTTNGDVSFDAEKNTQFDILEGKEILQKKLIMPSNIPVSSWNKLIKRSFLLEHGIRFYEGVIHEDVDFIYKVANYISSLAICHSNTYIYRVQREGSILNTTNNEKSLRSRLLIYNSCIDNTKNIDKDLVARSLFIRLQYILLTSPANTVIKKQLVQLCNKTVKMSKKSNGIYFQLYMILPLFLKRNKYIYNLLKKKWNK